MQHVVHTRIALAAVSKEVSVRFSAHPGKLSVYEVKKRCAAQRDAHRAALREAFAAFPGLPSWVREEYDGMVNGAVEFHGESQVRAWLKLCAVRCKRLLRGVRCEVGEDGVARVRGLPLHRHAECKRVLGTQCRVSRVMFYR